MKREFVKEEEFLLDIYLVEDDYLGYMKNLKFLKCKGLII